MKKLLTLFMSSVFLFMGCEKEKNLVVSPPESTYHINSNLKSVFFVDNDIGFTVGDSGTILKTTDRGETWFSVLDSTFFSTINIDKNDVHFYSIYFTNLNNGYVVGFKFNGDNSGIILNTIDGGKTWNEQQAPSNIYLSISFTDKDTGYVVGESGTVLKTTNGGKLWFEIQSWQESLYSVFFVKNTNVGYMLGSSSGSGGDIFKTVDGGINWSIVYNSSMNSPYFSSIYFTDTNNGYVGGNGIFLKTTDGGLTWTNMISNNSIINSIYFVNFDVGYAICSNLESSKYYFLKTINSGLTWDSLPQQYITNIYSLYFTDISNGYVVGDSGNILKTTNGGINFNKIN